LVGQVFIDPSANEPGPSAYGGAVGAILEDETTFVRGGLAQSVGGGDGTTVQRGRCSAGVWRAVGTVRGV
jgi:hypothetical protein